MVDHQTVVDAAKIAPPLVITTTTFFGYEWSTISYILASIYTALMIVHFVWAKWIRPHLRRR